MRKAMDDAGISQRKDPGALLPGLSTGAPKHNAAADPKITRKLIELENRVDTLVNNNPESDKALADRLGILERQLKDAAAQDQKRIDKANQILAKMDDRIKNLNRMTRSSDDAAVERFKELEKEMASLKKAGPKAAGRGRQAAGPTGKPLERPGQGRGGQGFQQTAGPTGQAA